MSFAARFWRKAGHSGGFRAGSTFTSQNGVAWVELDAIEAYERMIE